MYYVKTKRDKVGKCNLCLEDKSLSWDHVPPKGGIELSTMEMENLLNVFAGDGGTKIRDSQNGLKFRTLCAKCNNEILGNKYDPTINDFALSVGMYLKSNFKFPTIIHHKTKPVRLMKGILGHLVATKIEIDEVLFDSAVRELIFDENAPIPEQIKIFYWVYPYNRTVIMRDFAMPSVRGNFDAFGFFQTIKYFPIAYLATDLNKYEGLLELTKYRGCSIDEEVEIPIQLNRIEHFYWPELVDPGNFVMVGQAASNSVSASPKKIIKNGDRTI
jgi:hypothetical protein